MTEFFRTVFMVIWYGGIIYICFGLGVLLIKGLYTGIQLLKNGDLKRMFIA